MLIQFNFSNYKSFRNDTSLDLTATKITEHNDRVVSVANDRLLRIAAIYGANASGKSNIYDAFQFMSYYVIESFAYGDTRTRKNIKREQVIPFKFHKIAQNTKSTFEVFFIDNADPSLKTYQYGFSIIGSVVAEEWLYYKSKTSKVYKSIFYRNIENDQLDFDLLPKVQAENIKAALEAETLIISLGAKLKSTKLKMVYDWFIKNETANFSDEFENLYRSNRLPIDFVDNIIVQNNVIQYLNTFDESIIGFDIVKLPIENEKDNEGNQNAVYAINAIHRIMNSNDTAMIPLHEESKGTLEMFSLYQYIQDALCNGSVLFVDELNTKLHPLLVRNVILTFANPKINVNNSQLIFTTHDSWQLSNELLRRDEIWFTEKDANGITSLYSLADFVNDEGIKIRKDEVYDKNYMLGKYGAIPSLKSIDFLVGR